MAKTVVKGRGMPGKDDELYTLYDDGTILLRGVRGSYVHVGKAFVSAEDRAKGKAAKFSMVAMLPNATHEKAKRLVQSEIDRVLKERNNGKPIDDQNQFLRNGDLKRTKPEYAGHWTINASQTEDRPPALRGINGERIDREHMGETKIDAMFQSGYWYDILISPWWQDNTNGKKVNCNILAVKLAKKDETFGAGGINDDDVDDVFGVSGDSGGFDDDDGASDDL